jgi:hypothetical protein
MSHFDPEEFIIRQVVSAGFDEHDDIRDKWGFIRQAYMECLPGIMALGKKDRARWYDPYILDWPKHLNEVERLVWHSIRCRSVVLYPQLPVFNFFIDFANPYLRIGVEVDGKQHDKERDLKRDMLLASIGWKIFRIPASAVYSDDNNIPDQEGFDQFDTGQRETARRWLLETADGVIEAIRLFYFADSDLETGEKKHREVFRLAEETLLRHRLVDFPLRESNFTRQITPVHS